MWIPLQCQTAMNPLHLMQFAVLAFALLTYCSVGSDSESTAPTGEPPSGSPAPDQSGDNPVISEGDEIKLDYTGTLADGSIFDQSQEGSPLSFTVGTGQVIPGFDKAVVGMALQEEKKFTIPTAEAYGERNDAMIQQFGKDRFPADMTLEIGQVLGFQTQDGNQVPGTITDFGDDSVSVDFNHQLAGEDLTFDIKIVAIN